MSDWRTNPNLVECFENCVAMLRGMPTAARCTERDRWVAEIRRRRAALGLSQESLSRAMGKTRSYVSKLEAGTHGGKDRYCRITNTLARLEAERAQEAAE
jgi:hypothetical protein